jgi:hypothetical protein
MLRSSFISVFIVLALCISTGAGLAESMDPVDFLTDWPKLIETRVTLDKVGISNFTERLAMAEVAGQHVSLQAPWTEREDLRYLFAHCSGFSISEKCVMTVSGKVGKNIIGDLQLTDVDFVTP